VTVDPSPSRPTQTKECNPVSSARSSVSARYPRQSGRHRLPVIVGVPLALACAAAGLGAAPAHAAAPSRADTAPSRADTADTSRAQTAAASQSAGTPQAGDRFQSLRLPGLGAPSYTVTLITGAQVTLQSTGRGRYSATSMPAPGPDPAVDLTARGSAAGTTSVQAVPDSARWLISSGRVNPGLFDVLYLAAHGDTGPAARIPVIIAYTGSSGAAALGRLPGVVSAAHPAGGEVELSVEAGQAAAFWAALTAQGAVTAGPGGLADGATRIWLAGHDIAAPASLGPQAGQPFYPVTELVTRTAGPLQYSLCDGAAVHLFCATPFLLGVAGPALNTDFNPVETCLKLRPAKPYPVCDTLKFSYRVPAGVYFAGGNGEMLVTNDSDGTLENATVELDVPQFTVAGPTTISLNANHAVPVTVNTPLPTSNLGVPDSLESTRTLPGGQWSSSVTEAAYGDNNWWAVPSAADQRATIGGYTFNPGVSLGNPPVTAFVAAPGHLALHPLYPMYSQAYDNDVARPNRFTGRHTLSLVDAGNGTAAEFGKIDARGKLAMVRAQDGWVMPWQLVNAQHARAAGVLVNAAYDGGYVNALPVYLDTNPAGPKVPRNMPFAEIDAQEAATLTGLLAHGSVRITVDDTGQSRYAYFLSFNQEGGVPGSLHYSVSRWQLATVDASYHSVSPTGMDESPSAFAPDIFFAGPDSVVFAGPVTTREYYGPVSPDTVWWLQPEIPEFVGGLPTLTVFGQPASQALTWNEPPTALGALTEQARVNQAQPGEYWEYCAGCRQGNTFYPIFWLVSGANPEAAVDVGGFLPGSIHLYNQAGREIPPTPVAGLASYRLPPQPAGYTLVAPLGNTSTTWHFSSAAPGTDQTPPGTLCLGAIVGVSTAPCSAVPLVFLRYNAHTSLTDSVTAPGVHQIEVTAYHQAPDSPPIASLKLWISMNGGQSWQSLQAVGQAGTYQAFYRVPALADTNGYVSIKAQAADAAGNDVTQTILNGYSLTTGGPA
jgi:hypothetical protein